jgi:septum formation protein
MKSIVLASASPRRKQLLKQIGLDFRVVPSDIDERLNPRYKPRKQAEVFSLEKAEAVLRNVKEGVVIAADTLIAIGEEILVKPKDVMDAKRMIRKLSGREHSVFTGFTVIDAGSKKKVTKSVETRVWFRTLSAKDISRYIYKENPIGFAGAYKIQGYGCLLVEKIEGDYFNVVGLPLSALARELRRFGVEVI